MPLTEFLISEFNDDTFSPDDFMTDKNLDGWTTRVNLALDIARGLHALHCHNPTITYTLEISNIMVGSLIDFDFYWQANFIIFLGCVAASKDSRLDSCNV